jgi:hypothetical protein
MTQYQKSKLKKFAISLFWNGGTMLLAFMIDAIAQNLGIFNLSPEMTAFLGVILGRLSKAINVYIQENKELE